MVTPRNHTPPAVMCKRNGGQNRLARGSEAGTFLSPRTPSTIGRTYGFRKPDPKPTLVWG